MFSAIWQSLRRNKTFLYGVPMLLLIVGGSFGLREFAQIRYDIQKYKSKIDPSLTEMFTEEKITLESEYENIKDNKFETWENIRGPRPWEDSKSFQDQQRDLSKNA